MQEIQCPNGQRAELWVFFNNHLYGYRQNWTPLSPVTIIYYLPRRICRANIAFFLTIQCHWYHCCTGKFAESLIFQFAFQPLRACIIGPPASGKTLVIKQLCEHYKLHHIKIQDVIDEAVDKLVRSRLHGNHICSSVTL